MNPFLDKNNNLINNNQTNTFLNQLNSNESQMNPFLNQNNSMLMNNNPMMMNNNPIMMNNNPMMMNNNPMMMNNNPMMMNINNNNNNPIGSKDDTIFNYNNLNEVQKNLINQIIKFYQESGLFEMNLLNKNQINQLVKQLNPYSISDENKIYKLDDFDFIKTEKKLIKFVNSDFQIFYINIPTFITKFDLYSTVQEYKVFISTKILLIHDNKILNKDESSIDEISNNDFIFIIENRLYPDKSSYIFFKNKYPSLDCIIVIINFTNNLKKIYRVSREATIGEFINMVIEDNGLVESECKFYIGNQTLNKNDNKKIKETHLSDSYKILCNNSHFVAFYFYGKIIKGETMIKKQKVIVEIGTLNKITLLFFELEGKMGMFVKSIVIGNIRLKRDSDNCLFLYGINENFNFICEIENN